jgi:hypothetical protein
MHRGKGTKLKIYQAFAFSMQKSSYRFYFLILLSVSAISSRVIDRTGEGITLWSSAFTSDGLLYFFQSLTYKGYSRPDAISFTNQIFKDSGLQTSDESLSPTLVGVGSERPVYPRLMSLLPTSLEKIVPILWPILAFAGCVFLLDYILRNRYNSNFSLAITTIFATSFYVRFNFISATTDAITAFFILLGIFSVIRIPKKKIYFLILGLSIILSCGTRPISLIWLMLGMALLIRTIFVKDASKWIPILMISISAIFTLLAASSKYGVATQYAARGYDHLGLGYLFDVAFDIPKIIFVEFSYLFVHDLLVFFLVIFALYLSLLKIKLRFETICNLSCFLSCFVLASINGTIGVGFRYEMPIILTSTLVVAYYFQTNKSLSRFVN